MTKSGLFQLIKWTRYTSTQLHNMMSHTHTHTIHETQPFTKNHIINTHFTFIQACTFHKTMYKSLTSDILIIQYSFKLVSTHARGNNCTRYWKTTLIISPISLSLLSHNLFWQRKENTFFFTIEITVFLNNYK